MLFKNWLIGVCFRLNGVPFRPNLGRRKRHRFQGHDTSAVEGLESRQLLSGAPIALGSETQVNTSTIGLPDRSAIATDAAGDYVVAWTSHAQYGGGYGIFARRYNASGVAQGADFHVNTNSTSSASSAAVAMDATGDFVIAWATYGQDGSGWGIYAQRYDSAGVAQGGEFQVNTYTTNFQNVPSVAMDEVGDFVITWHSFSQDGSDYGIYARLYNFAGVPTSSEFRVNTSTVNEQSDPRVAMDAAGDFVITWSGYGQGGFKYDIYAQRYNLAGIPQGGEFLVSTLTTGQQLFPSIAMDTTGDFVISWMGPLLYGVSYEIFARRYDSAGVAQGADFQVNTQTANVQRRPRVAMDATGDFVITWISYQDGSDRSVDAQVYSSGGVAQDGEFVVNSFTSGDQAYPCVAMDSVGDFVLAWTRYTFNVVPITADAIESQRYQGNLMATPIVVLPTKSNVGATTATLGGDVILADGAAAITARGIVYALTSVNANPRLGGTGVTNVPVAGTTGVFTKDISGLTAGASYSFVAYATNSAGTTYTSQVSTLNLGASHAPAGTSGTVSTFEDTAHTFTTTDFGFMDPNDAPANSLLAVKITTLPANGTLSDNGTAVTAGQLVSAADISGHKLIFTPPANMNGTALANFAFQVQDDGGTANGGADIDPVAKLLTVDVSSVNDSPVGTSKVVTTLEDTAYTFTTTDFGFTDPIDTPTNLLLAVKISTLPSKGTLSDNGTAVTAGQFVSAADIAGNKLTFIPPANGNGTGYTSFTFQVQDDGGTSNGGIDTDPAPKTLLVNVTSVNDAPAGTSGTVTTLEDATYTFKTSDFGFADSNDSPANSLLDVRFTLLPTAGTIKDNGTAISVNQTVSPTDISGGSLTFTPNAGLSGGPYFLAKFQVQDNGGTANGGKDLDLTPKVQSVQITRVNHAPAGTTKTMSTLENVVYTFKTADFGFTDPNDSPANNLLGVKFTLLPTVGIIKDNGTAISVNQTVSATDITSGFLTFTPNANLNGGPFFLAKFQVQDNGGTANGGKDFDPTPNVLSVQITRVNQSPAGTSGTLNAIKNTPYVFKVADFGFTDPNDTPPNTLLAVKITLLPNAGVLMLNGVAITAGQFVSAIDINAGKFRFIPKSNVTGQYFLAKFQVQDNGGVANGGINLDPTLRVLSIKIT